MLQIPNYSIQCNGQLFSLHQPVVMGILNLTEDSFYDGGWHQQEYDAKKRVREMIQDGASIIDMGATTTKPGTPLSQPDMEINKLQPMITYIKKNFPDILISIDTYHSAVADSCLNSGAHIINDISGGLIDPNIFPTTAKHKAPMILMHIQGTPETMQVQPKYNQLIQEVMLQLAQQTEKALDAGIQDIIIDPGFGFGKNTEHNYELMNKLEAFHVLERPLLVGVSRKSMIWKVLNSTPAQALTGTIALNMVALQKGAHLLRVHDVKEAVETIKIYQALQQIG